MALSQADRLARDLVNREEFLRGERQNLEATWQQVALYTLPRKATFQEEAAPGVLRNRHVLDSTAPRSLELFASFLHTLLNNPAVRWLRLGVQSVLGAEDLELERDTEVRQYFERVVGIMLAVAAGEDANLYPQLHETYLDVGAFGTSAMLTEAPDGVLRNRSYHMADVVVDESAHGQVDQVYRTARLRPRQARQKWPDAELGRSVQQAPARQRPEPIEFLHNVFPMDEPEFSDNVPKRIKDRGSPFVSAWVNKRDRVVVSMGTYEEFPYTVPRWSRVRGDVYGRSPGMTALPDVRMANRMRETILRGAEKLVDPPLLLPDGGLVSPVRMFPAGLSFSDGVVEPKPLIPPGASRIEVGEGLLQQVQQAIREAFFVPLFATPDSPVKTATQVLQEVDERNRALSPMLIRMHTELFTRLVFRMFKLLDRGGVLPEPPDKLRGREMSVEYVSPLTASQRQLEALGTLRIAEALLPWAQIDPAVFDRFDPEEVAAVVHAGSGAPASMLRSKDEARQVRRAREDAQQAQAAAQQLIPAVEAGARVQTAQAAQTRAQRSGR